MEDIYVCARAFQSYTLHKTMQMNGSVVEIFRKSAGNNSGSHLTMSLILQKNIEIMAMAIGIAFGINTFSQSLAPLKCSKPILIEWLSLLHFTISISIFFSPLV